jgi:hypothetical protein
MVNYAGDYSGSNAQANRQAALQRRPTGAIGSSIGLSPTRAVVPRRSSGGGRITASPSGRYSRPAPPPAAAPGPIDPNAFLGADVGYQDQLRQFAKALTDFQSDVTRRQGNINTDFGTSSKALGDQRGLDLKNIETDFGSRGLLRSGLYGTAVGDYEKEYGQRLSELTTNKNQTLAQLLQEGNQFKTQQELQKQAAREAALRRRAEGMGI